jgi:cytochrome c peroxidase
MKPVLLFLIIFSFLINKSRADELDYLLRNRIAFYNLKAIRKIPLNSNRPLIELGKRLFSEINLSGNRRISCQTCHEPRTGTTDRLPLSQSENGKNILARNTPSLFNVGLETRHFMFWDGRVSYDPKTKVFTTPVEELNGVEPLEKKITENMKSALAAQAIFPLVTHNEMMGEIGENEIANAENKVEAWDRIIERLKKESPTSDPSISYVKLFLKAYAGTSEDQLNIGHVGEAIAAFQREEFQSYDSPFQRYLHGDNKAMTVAQKRGFAVFLGRGQCIDCHQGSELGRGDLFASVAAPQWGAAPFELDKGQGVILKDIKRNFFYKAPSLVNVKLTAPYMHNGAFQTIREVIEHYDYVSETLNDFKISQERQDQISVKVSVANQQPILDEIWLSSQSGLFPKLRNRLRLLDREKRFLETFLNEALTDPKWIK